MAPKRTLTGIFNWFVVLLLLCSGIPVLRAQEKKNITFTVVHLARKTNYSKTKLNQEIAHAGSKEAVKNIIRRKNFPPAVIIIKIEREGNQVSWWTISQNIKEERETELVLQSRGNTSLRLNRLSDFKNIFKDTVLLLDTLSVEMAVNDPNYPNDKFMFGYTCKPKKLTSAHIEYTGEKLLITPQLLSACPDHLSAARIYNQNNPNRSFAYFTIRVMNEEQKEALLSFANFYRKNNPEATLKDISFETAAYCTATFGTPFQNQVLAWLNTQLTDNGNTD